MDLLVGLSRGLSRDCKKRAIQSQISDVFDGRYKIFEQGTGGENSDYAGNLGLHLKNIRGKQGSSSFWMKSVMQEALFFPA